MVDILERKAVISGIGQSEVGRRLYRSPLDLTVDACLEAMGDAGLKPADIDGIATYPGRVAQPPGFSGVGVSDVQEAFRMHLNWYNGALENPGQLGSVITACAAIAAGYARHVLCFRVVTEGSAQGTQGRASVTPGAQAAANAQQGAPRTDGGSQWTLPFGAPSAANWIALNAMRHFHEFGTTREQMAWLAINERQNAHINPKAIYRDPITMEDYLNARMITSPLCLFDCDVPCDGATAFIVSSAETASDLRKPPVRIQAVGTALHGRNSWDQFEDLTTMALRDAGPAMWARTDLKPSDVDLAEMYDGFAFITMAWLEAMGFCGKGEAGPFLEGGRNTARDGKLPLNTHGGQLSAGRLHGYGFLHEACLQLWGEAGARQVAGNPQVGVAAAGGGTLAGCLLLTKD